MPDKSFTSLAPQDDDSRYDLAARQAKSLANLNARLVSGASARTGANAASATGVVIAANASRKRFGVQNAGPNVLTVLLGAGAVDLRAATAADAGNGARVTDDDWKGAVSISGSSPRYNWFEE